MTHQKKSYVKGMMAKDLINKLYMGHIMNGSIVQSIQIIQTNNQQQNKPKDTPTTTNNQRLNKLYNTNHKSPTFFGFIVVRRIKYV